MYGLKENLNSSTFSPLIFYVTKFTNYSYNTHNHMLIKGDGIKDRVESCLETRIYFMATLFIILIKRA